MSSQCARAWEVEAARDGRLLESARESLALHAQHCDACGREQARLARLSQRLRRVIPQVQDELVLRRERQHLLEVVNGRTMSAADSGKRRVRLAIWLAPLALGLIAFALMFAPRLAHRPPAASLPLEPQRLALTAAPGTRFEHERRPGLDFVSLQEGKLSIAFTRAPQHDLLLKVPDGEIRDLGTVFDVVVASGQTRAIAVHEGAVIFRRSGEEDVIVLAGETFERAAADADVGLAAAISGSDARSAASVATRRSSVHRRTPKKLGAAPTVPTSTQDADEDAAYLHIVALVEAGQQAEAKLAARAYVRDFPAGYRRREVEPLADAP
ncbi:MAG TPA: hypothetical protein VHZ95_06575 [Polyangiales bacterium]|nr:hypothetical protein [Polyangiales bacterium]